MDTTYFESPLAVSIAPINTAIDPGARRAHSGMTDGYHALVTEKLTEICPWLIGPPHPMP